MSLDLLDFGIRWKEPILKLKTTKFQLNNKINNKKSCCDSRRNCDSNSDADSNSTYKLFLWL